jgi:hypothetical protein
MILIEAMRIVVSKGSMMLSLIFESDEVRHSILLSAEMKLLKAPGKAMEVFQVSASVA